MKDKMKKIFFLLGLISSNFLFGDQHVVTNTNDSGDGSLRQAIIDANADETAPRIINFAIGSGVKTIRPATVLPALAASDITIDGTTQPGWSSGNPVIVLDGSLANLGFDGLTIDGVDRCTIQGLVINHRFLRGINIKNNVNNVAIYGCFIGTDQTGMLASGNAIGLQVSTPGATHNNNAIIGAPTKGNLISGNTYMGIFLSGNVSNSLLQSNIIGTDKVGENALSALQAGIAIGCLPIDAIAMCLNVTIGGSGLERNLISGNKLGLITGFQRISGLIMAGNIIGFDITETIPIPNQKDILTIT